MIFEQNKINDQEENQKQFKKAFGKTSPIFANQILVGQRKIKMLRRGYFKINDQINNLKITLTFIQLDN
jgi:hypothetical protein